jgi:hypothetical protein
MRAAACFALVCILACGSRTTPLAAGEAVSVPTCSEAVSSAPDASGSGCVAAAALVVCVGEDGDNEVCISNDPSSCSNGTAGTSCHDQCSASGEYAVACEGQAGAPPQPPSGCQNYDGAPTGTVYYCCPCSP